MINRSVASRLSKLFRAMHSRLEPDDVIDKFVATAPMLDLGYAEDYSGSEQQDAGEFLCRVIDQVVDEEREALHTEAEATEAYKLFRGKDEQRVSISLGRLRHSQVANLAQIICSGCGHVSTKTNKFFQLALSIPEDEEPVTVEALLKNNYSTIALPEDHKCEKCHQAGKTGKAIQITDIPRYLIVNLDRTKGYFEDFVYKQFKTKTRVPIPKGVIDLSDCCSLSASSDKRNYAVRGFAVHAGES